MGYYTSYSLTVDNEYSDNIIWFFREEYQEAKYAIDEDGSTCGDQKWYSHEDDLVQFSKGYPDTLFTLEGIGEEPDDLWRLYVKNGKHYRVFATISYESFDESKLKI